MILVLASIVDENAVSFARELGGSARVVTCLDLARGPSRIFHPQFQQSEITAGGERVRVKEISAVLNLLPAVFAGELSFYAPQERAYQAAEFFALLVYFLSSLRCPVTNRPGTFNLTGPVLNPAGWLATARAAGIPVAPLTMSSRLGQTIERENGTNVVFVADKIINPSGTAADEYTLALARHCGLNYLRATYRKEPGGVSLLAADSYPDIYDALCREALRISLVREAA